MNIIETPNPIEYKIVKQYWQAGDEHAIYELKGKYIQNGKWNLCFSSDLDFIKRWLQKENINIDNVKIEKGRKH